MSDGDLEKNLCNEFKEALEEISLRHQENGSIYGGKVLGVLLYVSCEILCSTQEKNTVE